MKEKEFDIVIIGGLGHIGLPLGIVFANKGLRVCLNDINKENAEIVLQGKMPYVEYGAEPILQEVLANGNLTISLDQSSISKAKYVVIAIGTPVDEYLNPKTRQFLEFIEKIKGFLDPNQIIIIRSSVYPNTCLQILKVLGDENLWHLAYCPERIVQGYAVKELANLPQIVAGYSEKAIESAADLFSKIAKKIIYTSMGEAELVKLFSNAWRYIQFAASNQFYMICKKFDVDYNKVRYAMVDGYDRARGLPSAGLAAGPCLLKDTMQLAAFSGGNFFIGHSAMMINEGLPNFIVEDLQKRHNLTNKKVGILGMSFKAEVDDIRDSLSFKLGKILRFHGITVFYSDEFAKSPSFISKEELVEKSDIVIIGVPHSAYKHLIIPKSVIEVVDLWEIIDRK